MFRKHFGIIAAVLTFSGAALAEENAPEPKDDFAPKTLVGEGEHHWGGFGAPVLKLTSLQGSGAVLFGGRGAAVLNHTFAFGGGGFGAPRLGNDGTFAYGGPTANFIFFSEHLIHFDVGAMVAWGVSNVGGGEDRSIFVVEPEANVELNVTRNFRIALGASYRHVMLPGGGEGAGSLSGLSGNLSFRFGTF